MSKFPPRKYVLAKSAVDGIQVFMPCPPDEKHEPNELHEPHEEVVEFSCPQCNATTAYCVENGGLTCTHCHYFEPPPYEIVGKNAEEFEFDEEIIERLAHGWGVERKELVCNRCGAHTTLAPEMLTHSCPFCGSNHVIQQKAAQDVLRPRFLIPFSITKEECLKNTAVWLENSWMLPPDLKKMARIVNYIPIFIPFWTFDADTSAHWQVEILEENITNNRKEWTWGWTKGQHKIYFDDLLVAGTNKISPVHLKQLTTPNLNKLVPYDASYLAGTHAQAYDLDIETSWDDAHRIMRKQMNTMCKIQFNHPHRNFSIMMQFEKESWRYILLPLYLTTYRYNNRVWQVIVQGENGHIIGQRPVDWKFVIYIILGIFMPTICFAMLSLLTQMFRPIAQYHTLFSNLTYITGMLSVIINFFILYQAIGMDDFKIDIDLD